MAAIAVWQRASTGEPDFKPVRMFPALVSCTTINWFSEWPPDALKEVATRFLESVELSKELLDPVSTIFAQTQTSVIAESSEACQPKRALVPPISPSHRGNGGGMGRA